MNFRDILNLCFATTGKLLSISTPDSPLIPAPAHHHDASKGVELEIHTTQRVNKTAPYLGGLFFEDISVRMVKFLLWRFLDGRSIAIK